MTSLLEKYQELGLVTVADQAFPPKLPKKGQPGHELSRHTPVWSYCSPQFAKPFDAAHRTTPLYAILSGNESVAEVTSQTHFICLFGATDSVVMAELATSDAVKIVFEPDEAALLDFLEKQDIRKLIERNFFFFLGDFRAHGWELTDVIPKSLTKLGFPATYVQAGRQHYREYFDEIIRRLEFCYYRQRIANAIGQTSAQGMPFRPMKRGVFYDQQRHFIHNIINLVKSGNPTYLKDTFPGTALLMGAGPGLKKQWRTVESCAPNVLTVSINSAYRYCLSQGFSPHITLISDTSITAGKSLDNMEGQNQNLLFGHWAASLGGDHFPKKYIGWEVYPDIFGKRPDLYAYGSVAASAFELARFMGATECVLTGFHMATPDPKGFAYASGLTGKYYPKAPITDEAYLYPDLYPVRGADGSELYTTLNFMDAAMCLLERMKDSGIRIVNMAPDSILHGGDIIIDPDYAPASADSVTIPEAVREVRRDPIDLTKVDDLINNQTTFYEEALQTAQSMLDVLPSGAKGLTLAEKTVARYDENGISYRLQRFGSFNNGHFHERFFDGKDVNTRQAGARHYFENLRLMALEFTTSLAEQRNRLHTLIKEHGTVY